MENQTNNKSIIQNLNRIEKMKTNKTSTMLSKASRLVGLFLVLGVLMGLSSSDVFAQVPPANTTIGNQASATYTDGGGNSRSVTSNTVETVVQQVYAVDISDGLTKTVSDGGQVQYPHIITNNGNGPDSFTISATDSVAGTDIFDFDNIVIYPDADLDGVPDNFSAITTTPTVPAGGSFGIVIVVTAPATNDDGENGIINVEATSTGDTNVSDTAEDEAIVRDGAVIDVQKSFSQSTASAGETISVTFRFSNNGNAAATNLDVRDPLPLNMTYVTGTGRWSGSGTTALGDNAGSGDDPSGITYEFDNSAAQDSILAIIANLGAGQSGTLTFDVLIGSVSGTTLSNTAEFRYDSESFVNTNTATVTVGDSYDVIIDPGLTTVGVDTVQLPAVSQGSQVEFVNSFRNNGTTTDVFNLTISEVVGSEYPTGTTFVLLKSDGAGGALNPFTDTNNDGIPDTGPVAAGADIEVILQVNLPASADDSGPFVIAKTATSINDATKSATLFDELLGITANSVDLTNNRPVGGVNVPGEGLGAGGVGAPDSTISTDPGNTIRFDLVVNNTSTTNSDSYDISLSGGTIPASWSVVFKDPNNGNSIITNTGSIAAGGNKEITAEIVIPAGFAPGNYDALFEVLSPTSGATDDIRDRVTVNTDRNISLVANQNGQIFPGGSKEYAHTLRIDSNVDENDSGTSNPSSFRVSVANSEASGFTAIVYWDKDNSGDISTGDSVLTNAGGTIGDLDVTSIGSLSFGDEVNFVIKVTAGTGVKDGVTNTTTITITDNNGQVSSVANADITKVVAGLLVLEKTQASDTTGFLNGAGTDPFSIDPLTAAPGDSVYYKIVITNNGAATVDDVEIVDTTPSYTVMRGTVVVFGDIDPGGVDPAITEPGDGNAGAIRVEALDLAPYETFTIIFKVKLNE